MTHQVVQVNNWSGIMNIIFFLDALYQENWPLLRKEKYNAVPCARVEIQLPSHFQLRHTVSYIRTLSYAPALTRAETGFTIPLFRIIMFCKVGNSPNHIWSWFLYMPYVIILYVYGARCMRLPLSLYCAFRSFVFEVLQHLHRI